MAQSVTCPKCNRTYAMKPEFAGKRAKCKCGERIQFPPLVEELTEADIVEPTAGPGRRNVRAEALEQPTDPYGLADAAPQANVPPPLPPGPACVNCGAMLQEGAVICMQCGTNQRTGKSVQTQVTRNLPKARPAPASAAAPVVSDEMSGLDWVLCFLCPGIAFIVAIVRLVQGRTSSGLTMLITSFIMSAIYSGIQYFALAAKGL